MKILHTFEQIPAWCQFVLDHGHQAMSSHLICVIGQPIADIKRVQATGACAKRAKGKDFVELFTLWHGREPVDAEWPAPIRYGRRNTYEWQGPELALLASLIGTIGKAEIARILTARLRQITKDETAARTETAIQVAMNRIGMQAKDVIGGITTTEAGRQIGSVAIVNQAIHKGNIRAIRVGRLWVIPYETWAAWKAKRVFPPDGFIPLADLKEPLAIRSDKLSEFARFGYIPTALRCNPYGSGRPSTQFGTWYVDANVAKALIADRQAGRAMPWHGKPLADNLRVTFKLWQSRQHPTSCKTCAQIWGRKGVPGSFEDYAKRYPPLAHGAKRHLTMVWTPGMTLQEVAEKARVPVSKALRAIRNGALDGRSQGGQTYVTRTDATRWITRKCPTGDQPHSWISMETAQKRFLFTRRDLNRLIAEKKLKSKLGTDGAMRGILYVSKSQCALIREKIGFTEHEAARRAGVTLTRFRAVLEGVHWRKTGAIPLFTLQAVIARLKSSPGYTIAEAATKIGKPVDWIEARIADGTVRVSSAKWETDRLYLSEPMIKRLLEAGSKAEPQAPLSSDWLRVSEAAHEAGVTAGTIVKWAKSGELEAAQTKIGLKYHRAQVRARARLYWASVRFRRARPPVWLQEQAAA
jgi:hypothetical protein